MKFELPSDATEADRKRLLAAYEILDTEPEPYFDDIVKLASQICGVPMAAISFLDGKRQWFKAATGLGVRETPIEYSFCAHAVGEQSGYLEINDAREDDRFMDNPLVSGNPNIQAYAGATLRTANGTPLGTICVIDTQPRDFTEEQSEALQILSKQVMTQLLLKVQVKHLEAQKRHLEALNAQLDQFAYIIGHDLQAPIRHQASFAKVIMEDFETKLPDEVVGLLKEIIDAGGRSKEIISDINEYLHTVARANANLEKASVKDVIEEALQVSKAYDLCDVEVESEIAEDVMVAKVPMRHVLLNLINNAVKYSNKDRCALSLRIYEHKYSVFIDVGDNGPGIKEMDQKRIFQLFKRGTNVTGQPGRGIGLAIAAKLLQVHDGSISVKSELGRGAIFTICMPKDSIDLEEVKL